MHALIALISREDSEIEVDQEVIDALVDVFACWSALSRDQRRALARDFQIRIGVQKPPKQKGKRARLEVASIRLGVFRDDFSI